MIRMISVESALIEGLMRFDMVYTKIEILDTPLPVTKYEITKSSKLIVNAMSAPLTMPGLIWGTMTLKSACQGVHPRSIAASARFWSSVRSFGAMLSITYGIQNIMCARSIVRKPLRIWIAL